MRDDEYILNADISQLTDAEKYRRQRLQSRNWYKQNKEVCRMNAKIAYQKNRQDMIERSKQYYRNHREEILQKARQRRLNEKLRRKTETDDTV